MHYHRIANKCSKVLLKRIYHRIANSTFSNKPVVKAVWGEKVYRRNDLLKMCNFANIEKQEISLRKLAFKGFEKYFTNDTISFKNKLIFFCFKKLVFVKYNKLIKIFN